jgi:anti-sigma regulatory factor (Ser/Thr protein kinase)
MSTVQMLPAVPDSPSVARTLVRAELAGCTETTVTTAELMVSELVTNAVVHGGTPIRVELEHGDHTVRAMVTDGGNDLPVLRHPERSSEHGRGLMIVSTLADDWGVIENERGKSVWFSLLYR